MGAITDYDKRVGRMTKRVWCDACRPSLALSKPACHVLVCYAASSTVVVVVVTAAVVVVGLVCARVLAKLSGRESMVATARSQ